MGVKGALQGALRVATRNLFASIFKTAFGREGGDKPTDRAEVARANRKSLLMATALLYTSWVIVIAFGQPFADLKTAAKEGSESEVRALLARGATADADALRLACESGHRGCAQLLLEAKADVNVALPSGHTALMIARAKGHTAICTLLHG